MITDRCVSASTGQPAADTEIALMMLRCRIVFLEASRMR
jgi:hypothetical protein